MAVQHKLNGTSQRERRNALSQLPRQKAADPTATANAIFAASGIGPLKELENQPLVHETHCCEDGSFGVADFLGMKRAEDGEIVADYLIGSSPCQDLPHKARWGDKK